MDQPYSRPHVRTGHHHQNRQSYGGIPGGGGGGFNGALIHPQSMRNQHDPYQGNDMVAPYQPHHAGRAPWGGGYSGNGYGYDAVSPMYAGDLITTGGGPIVGGPMGGYGYGGGAVVVPGTGLMHPTTTSASTAAALLDPNLSRRSYRGGYRDGFTDAADFFDEDPEDEWYGYDDDYRPARSPYRGYNNGRGNARYGYGGRGNRRRRGHTFDRRYEPQTEVMCSIM
ncbi:MAG: hypothetical protein M1825_004230 [Sarcosagium campestre]|nr:MAG: hypothetical protein M1825_004230 [Sarcosagium campestre]